MRVETKISEDKKEVSISINQRFDFSQHQFFRNAYSQHKIEGTKFIVDLSKTEYIDSSALGMILLLKDYVAHITGTLVIRKPSTAVSKILEIAQFHRLMTIEQ